MRRRPTARRPGITAAYLAVVGLAWACAAAAPLLLDKCAPRAHGRAPRPQGCVDAADCAPRPGCSASCQHARCRYSCDPPPSLGGGPDIGKPPPPPAPSSAIRVLLR